MKQNGWKVVVVIALVAAVGIVIANKVQSSRTNPPPVPAVATAPAAGVPPAVAALPPKLPKLVDLGANKCVPCKMMAPILETLAKDFKGKLIVEFIDVWQNPDAGDKYGIQSIPTQIFYDADGKEFFRHEGFFAKEDILAKFQEKGYRF